MPWLAALACALAGVAVWQFFGNATRGYIDTASLFYWWGWQWFNPASETEHGPLIVAIAAWVWWRNLGKPETGERKPAFAGPSAGRPEGFWTAIAAMLGGLALHAVGFAAQQTRLSIVALLVFAWGAVRLGGGRRWGGAAVFPLALLLFAVPVNVLDTLGFWLRLWVIKASAGLAHVAGMGVLQNGTQLLAPDGRFNYDVAPACSGVRSLMALTALTLLAGYISFRTWWRRGAILLLCFPLVYLGNVARITSIIFAAQWGGTKWGEFAHQNFGFVVFVVVFGGVLGAVELLRRFAPEATANEEGKGKKEEVVGGARVWPGAAAIVALAVGEMFFLNHLAHLPPRGTAGVLLASDGKNPADLPAILGRAWVGMPAAVTPIEREILPPDTGYARMNYTATFDGRRVYLSIVLSGRDRTSIHRPELCLLGQGWSITGATEQRFKFPRHTAAAVVAEPFPVTVLRVQREVATPRGREVVPQVVAYWFVGGDAIVATHWQRLALDGWNRVVHGRADRWAYVLVQTDAVDGEAAALLRMQAVLNETLPAFQRSMTAR